MLLNKINFKDTSCELRDDIIKLHQFETVMNLNFSAFRFDAMLLNKVVIFSMTQCLMAVTGDPRFLTE